MSEPIYKKIELVGTSDVSIEAAVNNAIAVSNRSIRNLSWFEVDEIRGRIKDGQVDQWQVGLKLGFSIENTNVTSLPQMSEELGEISSDPASRKVPGTEVN